ncbi:MAG: endonuclease/exonuclease/phosphatase family protein [Aeromonas sp.]
MCSLNRYTPDVLCLQETKRRAFKKPLFINRYTTYEVPAEDNGLGLLIAVRHDTKLEMKIISESRDAIFASLKGNGINCTIANVYRPHHSARKKELTAKIASIVNKNYNENEIILIGDWNEVPGMIVKKLSTSGIIITANDAPSKGTRINKRRRRTKRPLDFAISPNEHLIRSQSVKLTWRLSDYFPVLVKLNVEKKDNSAYTCTTLDRKRLTLPKIRDELSKHDYLLFNIDTM